MNRLDEALAAIESAYWWPTKHQHGWKSFSCPACHAQAVMARLRQEIAHLTIVASERYEQHTETSTTD